MKYTRPLPAERRLVALARNAHFPVGRDGLIALAEQKGFAASTILFLRLFGPNDTFESSVDFINRCEELKLLIREERAAPKELLRSPQE